jgi:isopentenyl diphosphate isomerase/L-lactate dehydrogenase-like FMN-dependent dehydrogenase
MFGVSSLGTVSVEELRKAHDTPQVYQLYFHKDRGLNRALLQRAKDARVEIMMLTVDSTPGQKHRNESGNCNRQGKPGAATRNLRRLPCKD